MCSISWKFTFIKQFDLRLDKGKGSIIESVESGGTIHLIIQNINIMRDLYQRNKLFQ